MSDAPLFEQIAVLKEVDLHKLWAPFCTSSRTIADLDPLDVVGWFMIGMPTFGLARDGCFRAIGCDNTQEDGTVLMAATGIQDENGKEDPEEQSKMSYLKNDPVLEKLDIPDPPSKRGSRRMTIRSFDAVVHVTSPTSVETTVFANVNPNLDFLPESLLEFGMKHLAGVVLAQMQKAARKATLHPESNAHAQRMRQESAFYERWLMTKFIGICTANHWEVPHVAALNIRPHLSPVVDNMAALTRTARHSRSADNLSEISTDSSRRSVWSNNPVTKYLKKVEERELQRKLERIEETRRKTREQLIPSGLDQKSRERLRELKARLAVTQDGPRQISDKFSRDLHSHDVFTRAFVMTVLVGLLFSMCYPSERFFAEWFTVASDAEWKDVFKQNGRLLLYSVFCAVAHYLVCKVALVYALDTLELAAKLGLPSRDYYSKNVRRIVAATSLGTVFVGTVVFSIQEAFHAFMWMLCLSMSAVSSRLHIPLDIVLDAIPPGVTETIVKLYSLLMPVAKTTVSLAWDCGTTVYTYTVEPTFVGDRISSVMGLASSSFQRILDTTQSFLQESQNFGFKTAIHAVTMGTFNFSTTVFAYSAIFLVVLLMLYNIYLYGELVLAAFSPKTTREPTMVKMISGDLRDIPIPEERPMTPVTDQSSNSTGQ